MEINGEQAAERDLEPSASVNVADPETLLDAESDDSSTDTLEKVQEELNNTAAAAVATTAAVTTDITKVNKDTEEVLEGLLASPERPTRRELEQDKQGTKERTQELFTNKEKTQEKMETLQNLKRKPITRSDLRTKFGQSPKPRKSPKHKRRKDKLTA